MVDFVPVVPASRNRGAIACRLMADCVEKLENRATQKISQKSISGHLCCCIACQRCCGGPLSIFDGMIWSLTSSRVRRISCSKNFRISPQKEFFNTIGTSRTSMPDWSPLSGEERKSNFGSGPLMALSRHKITCRT